MAGLTLTDLRTQLSAEATAEVGRTASTISDEQLQPFLDSAIEVATDYCGLIVPTEVTETYDGGRSTIVLRGWPVVEVTTVLDGYTATTPTATSTAGSDGWTLKKNAGVLSRVAAGGTPRAWSEGTDSVTVTYTTGLDPVPASVALGLLILAQHLYGSKVGQASQRPAGTTAGPMTAYAVPNRVLELWRPFMRPPNIA